MPDEERLTKDYFEDAVVHLLVRYAQAEHLDTVLSVPVHTLRLLASKIYPAISWLDLRIAMDTMSDRLLLSIVNPTQSKNQTMDVLFPEIELRELIAKKVKGN